jgi:hypothetical protein
LVFASISSSTQKNAEFEGHIEPGQLVLEVNLCSGNVMDAKGAGFYEVHDLVDTSAAAIIDFKRATGVESASDHGEDNRVKKFLIFAIEGAVYKRPLKGNCGASATNSVNFNIWNLLQKMPCPVGSS